MPSMRPFINALLAYLNITVIRWKETESPDWISTLGSVTVVQYGPHVTDLALQVATMDEGQDKYHLQVQDAAMALAAAAICAAAHVRRVLVEKVQVQDVPTLDSVLHCQWLTILPAPTIPTRRAGSTRWVKWFTSTREGVEVRRSAGGIIRGKGPWTADTELRTSISEMLWAEAVVRETAWRAEGGCTPPLPGKITIEQAVERMDTKVKKNSGAPTLGKFKLELWTECLAIFAHYGGIKDLSAHACSHAVRVTVRPLFASTALLLAGSSPPRQPRRTGKITIEQAVERMDTKVKKNSGAPTLGKFKLELWTECLAIFAHYGGIKDLSAHACSHAVRVTVRWQQPTETTAMHRYVKQDALQLVRDPILRAISATLTEALELISIVVSSSAEVRLCHGSALDAGLVTLAANFALAQDKQETVEEAEDTGNDGAVKALVWDRKVRLLYFADGEEQAWGGGVAAGLATTVNSIVHGYKMAWW
ncbi:hypothetical protein JCM3774_000626, partial [Rhodotorula dairenensis]